MAPNAPTLTDHPVAALAFALVNNVGRTTHPDVQRPVRPKSGHQIRSHGRT